MNKTYAAIALLLCSCSGPALNLKHPNAITDRKEIEKAILETRSRPRIQADITGNGIEEIIEAVKNTEHITLQTSSGETEIMPVQYAYITIHSPSGRQLIGRVHLPQGIMPRLSFNKNKIIVDVYNSATDSQRYVSVKTPNGEYSGLFQQ